MHPLCHEDLLEIIHIRNARAGTHNDSRFDLLEDVASSTRMSGYLAKIKFHKDHSNRHTKGIDTWRLLPPPPH
jgi:hypothetical protein